MSVRLIIPSAGKQTRWESETPKSLYRLSNGETVLERNIKAAYESVDEIILIVSDGQSSYYKDLNFYSKVKICSVDGGGGASKSIYRAYEKGFLKERFDTNILKWGDTCHFHKSQYSIERRDLEIIIPVKLEKNPYAFFPVSGNKIMQFNKLGQSAEVGFHDMSIFYVPQNFLDDVINYGDSGIGDDLNPLYLFESWESYIILKRVDFDEKWSSCFSYNSLKEIEDLKLKGVNFD